MQRGSTRAERSTATSSPRYCQPTQTREMMVDDRQDCRQPPCRRCLREGCKGSATDRQSPYRLRCRPRRPAAADAELPRKRKILMEYAANPATCTDCKEATGLHRAPEQQVEKEKTAAIPAASTRLTDHSGLQPLSHHLRSRRARTTCLRPLSARPA